MEKSGYQSFAEHSEYFLINGVSYTVTANFVTGWIFIKGGIHYSRTAIEAYDEFEGNMGEFAAHIIGKTQC